MLQYLGMTIPLEMTTVKEPVPTHRMLMGLPSYCYDVHTRIGLEVLKRLVRGVQGAEEIKEMFREYRVASPHKVMGEALFAVEGGRIQGELIYEALCSLEQRLFAHRFELPPDAWYNLRVLVAKALNDGVIDRVREEVLDQSYSSLFVPKECTKQS